MYTSWDGFGSLAELLSSHVAADPLVSEADGLAVIRNLGAHLRCELGRTGTGCDEKNADAIEWLEDVLVQVDQYRREVGSFRRWCWHVRRARHGGESRSEGPSRLHLQEADSHVCFHDAVVLAMAHLPRWERGILHRRAVERSDFEEISRNINGLSPEVAARVFDNAKYALLSRLEADKLAAGLGDPGMVSDTFNRALSAVFGFVSPVERHIVYCLVKYWDDVENADCRSTRMPSRLEEALLGRIRDFIEMDADICREWDSRRLARAQAREEVFSQVVAVLDSDDVGRFLNGCEDIANRAVLRWHNIDRIRGAASRVPYSLTLADYLHELVNAAGVTEADASIALGLHLAESWAVFNEPTHQTVQAVRLLQVDRTYARQALRIPSRPASAVALRQSVSEMRDVNWVCREIQRHLDEALENGNPSFADILCKREREIAVLFADDLEF